MEKKFVIPELEIVFFSNDDIVTTSDPANDPGAEEGSYNWGNNQQP